MVDMEDGSHHVQINSNLVVFGFIASFSNSRAMVAIFIISGNGWYKR